MSLRRFFTLTSLAIASVWVSVNHASVAAKEDIALLEAVKRADHSTTQALLSRGVDVNASEPDGTTALHWAAHHGQGQTVTRLIGAGADVRATNRYGIEPIWLAAQNGHAVIVEALLDAGASPNTVRGNSGETILMIAARGGHVDVLQRLVSFDADVTRKEHVRGQTALMWATAEAHRDAATLLLDAGADLDVRSSTGITPLMFAIRSGDISTTQELLDQGADLRVTGPDGTTMLVLGILNAHWELAKLLLEHGADPNRDDPLHGRPLHALTIVRRAQNRGLSPVLPRTPSGNISSIELAETLLAHGAVINDRIDWDNPMHVPPHMALSYSFGLSYLGATPFFIASKNCDVEFMKFLLANGADPFVNTEAGVSPLLAAAGAGFITGEAPGTAQEAFEAVKLLRRVGQDLFALMGDASAGVGRSPGIWKGASALHAAVHRGAMELAKWLIDQGVRLDHRMANGMTPLDVAQGSRLAFNYKIEPALAEMLRQEMIELGLPVPVPVDRSGSFER
jgi:ankyrin repeat protein